MCAIINAIKYYSSGFWFPGIFAKLARILKNATGQTKKDADGNPDFETPFYLLKYTYAAAVTTENLFYDNPEDLAFLESEEGRKAIVALHVEGIVDYLEHLRF